MNQIIRSLLADDVIREQRAELERQTADPTYWIEWPVMRNEPMVYQDFTKDSFAALLNRLWQAAGER